ncbi:hypothetical protein H0H93_006513 [Arthromyces matolae]|nr:hypothetical protein H0H93_006513 [Arthromyces matolae]
MSDSVKTVSETCNYLSSSNLAGPYLTNWHPPLAVNAPDGDLTIESCDNILFHVHRKNLEVHSGAFPPSEFKSTKGEILSLTEDAHTLTMLFQYVYPRRNPDIELLTFDSFYKLAEAAEKYQIFSAMDSCKLRVRHFLASNPAEILAYAHKHDYPDILDEAVHYLLDLLVQKAMNILPPHLAIPWERHAIMMYGALQFAKSSLPDSALIALRKKNSRSDTELNPTHANDGST